jgi:hypothetical protein
MLGKRRPDARISAGNLASVLRDQGKYEEAEETHRRPNWDSVSGKEPPADTKGF